MADTVPVPQERDGTPKNRHASLKSTCRQSVRGALLERDAGAERCEEGVGCVCVAEKLVPDAANLRRVHRQILGKGVFKPSKVYSRSQPVACAAYVTSIRFGGDRGNPRDQRLQPGAERSHRRPRVSERIENAAQHARLERSRRRREKRW